MFANSLTFNAGRHLDQAIKLDLFWRPELIIGRDSQLIEDHYCLPNRGFRTGGQDDTTAGDVISFSTETKPVREIHWLGMCYLLMTSFLVVSDPSPLKG